MLNQLSIVIGILVTQLLGFKYATPTHWRYVLFFSSAFSLVHLLVSASMTESPAWLEGRGLTAEVEAARQRLFGRAKLRDEGPPTLRSLPTRISH